MSYKDSQQAASEALRLACDETITDQDAVRYANSAEKHAMQAVLDASNTREIWLAMQQVACATGLRVIIEAGIRAEIQRNR